MATIQVFIISWAGQHERASRIAQAVAGAAERVTIVYSDPDPAVTPQGDCELLRRPNELFWGDKFKACVDARTEDLLLIIHSDCDCDDWAGVVRSCRTAFERHGEIGVWAPRVDYAYYNLDSSAIYPLDDSGLSVAANTDGIVFALSAAVADRMRRADYSSNIYGWGADAMYIAYTYANGLVAVIDAAAPPVSHPHSTGYDSDAAFAQMAPFLTQLTAQETIQHRILSRYIQLKINSAPKPSRWRRLLGGR